MGGETSQGNDIDLFFGDLVENLDFGFMWGWVTFFMINGMPR
jgi:hypothetical protein